MIKKRKGMMLPLIIITSVFIMILGALALSVSDSGHLQTYGNIQKLQSYNLAKSGIEMGLAFLYSPSDSNNPLSINWFAKSRSGESFDKILDDLKSATTSQGTSSANTEELQVYLKTVGTGDARKIESAHVYKKSDMTSTREGEHFGDLEIKITLVDKGGSKKMDECIYRIESKAKLNNESGDRINTEHRLIMEVSAVEEFDRTLL